MRVLVFGAGAIGGYLGGVLAQDSRFQVTFLVREYVAQQLAETGLRLTDYQGRDITLEPPIAGITALENFDGQPDVVLLTVKCTGVSQAAEQLAPWLSPTATVVCLQNGIGSLEEAQRHLGQAELIPGMVPFNVARPEPGRLHRGTEGTLVLKSHPKLQALAEAWNTLGIPTSLCQDFEQIAWGKLLLNLNNAINALSGIPLLEQLQQRDYRLVLSKCMRELLAALKAADIKPAKLTRAPAFLVPWILLLPNWLFRLVARQMLAIDPLARSSMWEDLEQRRPTEIEYLNQAVVDLAGKHGLPAPVNASIVSLIKSAESQNEGSPHMSGHELLRICSLA